MGSQWLRSLSVTVAATLLAAAAHAAAPALPGLRPEQHPGLLFDSTDLGELRSRVQREPYATWWHTVRQRAVQTPVSLSADRDRAHYAKALAFVYAITDSLDYARRATELLLDMRFPPRGGDVGEPHSEGEVVAQYTLAYDWLDTYLVAVPEARSEIRAILAEEAARIHEGIVIREIDLGLSNLVIRLHETGHLGNWHIRAYAGLGLAALALSDHPGTGGATPHDWAANAYGLVTRSLEMQVEEIDGGYAEGPFYLRYAADLYLPYMLALRRQLDLDLLAWDPVSRAHRWSLNLRLPSGRRPNVDDAHLDDFYGHYLAAVDPDGSIFAWDWAQNTSGLYVRHGSEMDAIALYDDTVAAVAPAHGPTVFMPGAGDAVFRSNWSSTGTYLLLRGEHGTSRERGLAHEHPDETSFVLHAGGEMLALDAGYIEFAEHDRVNRGANHNVILVDGLGPPLSFALGQVVGGGNDAYIRDTVVHAAGDYAQVHAAYGGVELLRRVAFPDRSFFVVADEIRAPVEHDYQWRLHGNGGGTSGGAFTRMAGSARWSRAGAELLTYVPERGGRVFGAHDTLHSFDYRQTLTHSVLTVEERAADTEFLSVLFPLVRGQEEPVVGSLPASHAQVVQVLLGTRRYVAWSLDAAADTAQWSTADALVRTDARFGVAMWDGGLLTSVHIQDGSMLATDGVLRIQASAPVDAVIRHGQQQTQGFVRGPESPFRLSVAASGPVERARFGDTSPSWSVTDSNLVLVLNGSGVLEIVWSAQNTGTADFDGNGAVELTDFFLFADAFGRPADGDNARFDLDRDGTIGFGDFFLFADLYQAGR
jgi:hypothetical protein